MGDADRALKSRPRHPLEYPEYPSFIDHELTPPPQAPPSPDTLPDYDTISPPVREQLAAQHAGIERLTAGLEQVWDARRDGARFDRLEDKVDGLATDSARTTALFETFLRPSVMALQAAVSGVETYMHSALARDEAFAEHQWPQMQGALERVTKMCEQIVERLNRTEQHVDRLIGLDDTRRQSLHALTVANDVQDMRLAALEKRFADTDAGDKRELVIVTRSKARRAAIVGGIASVGAAVAAGVQWLVTYLRGSP
ncbi:MAG: hypothetical protein ABIR65_01265 [Pseudolysinimonas sp.]